MRLTIKKEQDGWINIQLLGMGMKLKSKQLTVTTDNIHGKRKTASQIPEEHRLEKEPEYGHPRPGMNVTNTPKK